MREIIVENKVIEVVYFKAKLGRRIFALFIDISLFILTTFILFSITNTPITNSSWYKAKDNQLTEIRNESGLYVEGIVLTTYVEQSGSLTSFEQKKVFVSERIDTFYNNTTYIKDINSNKEQYNQRKLTAKTDKGVNLFILDGSTIVENNVSDELLYNFYKDEIDNFALAQLFNSNLYFNLVQFSFLTTLVQFISLIVLTYSIYFVVLPLTCFKRGRQTIGLKLSKIGLISVRADNVTPGKYIGRSIFNFFIFVVLNFFSFLIPSFVSLGMMFFSKRGDSLTNYVFNDYAVDVSNQSIYFNALEREEQTNRLKQISIENKDLRLK